MTSLILQQSFKKKILQQEWSEGSLEEKVQRLLKTWEMEMVHKVRPEDQKSVNHKKYAMSNNGDTT